MYRGDPELPNFFRLSLVKSLVKRSTQIQRVSKLT